MGRLEALSSLIKLYTRSKKRGDVHKVLNVFVQHGASDDILIDSHPHIGSNKLPKIVEHITSLMTEEAKKAGMDALPAR